MAIGSTRLRWLLALAVVLTGCAALRPARELPSLTPSSIIAEAVVELDNFSGRAAVYATDSGSFRIEVKYPFGQVAALLISNGVQLYSFSGGEENRYVWGDPASPLQFESAEVASLLMGLKNAELSNRYDVERDSEGRVSRVKKEGGFTITLSDYSVEGGAEVPHMIVIRSGAKAIRIKYNSVEVNPAMPEGVFEAPAMSSN